MPSSSYKKKSKASEEERSTTLNHYSTVGATSSKSTSDSSDRKGFDIESETILFDCMASVVPISYYKPFSMLNAHVVLKREANLQLPIEEIEERVGLFYNLKVLEEAKDVPPLIQTRKIEYFKLPADIVGAASKSTGTQKKKKKK